MVTSIRTMTRSVCFLMAAAAVPATQAEAGPFLNWLLGRPVTVYPSPYVAGYPGAPVAAVPTQTAYYAPGVAVAPAYTVGNAAVAAPVVAQYPTMAAPGATVVANSPVIAGSPVVAQSPVVTPIAVQPVMTGYTTYRTTWNRIPVTYYRPVTSYQAGYAVTAAQPCNTYTWQAQRVPLQWHHRPWVPFASAAPVTYGYAPVTSAPLTYAPAPATPGCAGCPTTAPAAGTGLYYPAAPASAATMAPQNYVLPQGVSPGVTAPSVQPYSDPSQVPAGSYPATPADQAPTLVPGYDTNPAPSAPPALQSVPGTNPPAAMTVPAAASNTQKPATSPYQVTPIPAPDLRSYDSQRASPQAPPLLKERERTALNSAGQAVVVEHASYVTAKPLTPVKQPATSKTLWNDSGWRTAK